MHSENDKKLLIESFSYLVLIPVHKILRLNFIVI